MRELDPNSIMMNFAGIPVTGVADGTFVKIAFSGKSWTLHKGEQGDATRVRDRKVYATVTFTLGAQSPTNSRFATKLRSDLINGDGVGPILIKDLKGTMVFSSDEAFIDGNPDWERSGSHSPQEWAVIVPDPDKCFLGGALK